MPNRIQVQKEWEDLLASLQERGSCTLYVIGATDRGKSTFCRYVVSSLAAAKMTAYLDCDTGQSTIGPPTTVGLALYYGTMEVPQATYLRFVGSTSPTGHIIQEMVSAARLRDRAREEGATFTIIDSPGWALEPAAQEFHVRMIDLLAPDRIAAIQRGQELEGILVNFKRRPGMDIWRLPASPAVIERRRGWRRIYRQQQFDAYFSIMERYEIPLAGMGFHGRLPETFRDEAWRDLIIALCDSEMMVIRLGIVEHLDLVAGTLSFFAPPFDLSSLASVHVGSVHLDLTADVPSDTHSFSGPRGSGPGGQDPGSPAPGSPAPGV